MADFPITIFTPRDTENLPGITFDPAKKNIMFSEDYQALGAEIEAIETYLLTPKRFKAIVTQYSTSAPVLTIIENTLGFTPTFLRLTAGVYYSNDAEWYDFISQPVLSWLGYGDTRLQNGRADCQYSREEGVFYIFSYDGNNDPSDSIIGDEDNFRFASLSIEVYPS